MNNGRWYRLLIVLCICAIECFVVEARAQEAADVPLTLDSRALIQGVKEARLKLTSGVVRGKGRRSLGPKSQGVLEGDISFFCAFDYPNRRIRTDREEPIVNIDSDTRVKSIKQIGYKLVQLPEKSIYCDWTNGIHSSDSLYVVKPDYQPPAYGKPVDVRTFGLVDWGSFDGGASFPHTIAAFNRTRITKTREVSDGQYVLTAVLNDNIEISTWVDSGRGYTIPRMELRMRDVKTKEWGDVVMLTEVRWAERNEVWIPIAIHLERNFNGREFYYANLTWEQVNSPPADILFEPEGMGLDADGNIFDHRQGKTSVFIRRIGGVLPVLAPVNLLAGNDHILRRILWLVAGNMLVIAAFCGIYYRNRFVLRR